MLENAPTRMRGDAAEMRPRPGRIRRRQARYRNASEVDGRTRAGRRAKELIRQFEVALGEGITDGQRLAIHRAAVLTAVAEDTRMRRLAGEAIPLDDLVRVDRLAAQAVRQLGISSAAKPAVASTFAEIAAQAQADAARRRAHELAADAADDEGGTVPGQGAGDERPAGNERSTGGTACVPDRLLEPRVGDRIELDDGRIIEVVEDDPPERPR
jgi:hypothetical protein